MTGLGAQRRPWHVAMSTDCILVVCILLAALMSAQAICEMEKPRKGLQGA